MIKAKECHNDTNYRMECAIISFNLQIRKQGRRGDVKIKYRKFG